GQAMRIPDGLDVRVETRGGRATVILAGELDMASVETVSETLRSVEVDRPSVIALDLRRLRFMDSTGLALAVRAHMRARREGRRFVVVPGPPQVQRAFSVTGLDTVLEFEHRRGSGGVEQPERGMA